MVSVEQLIGNLLLRHNCVIIPSFGGFVAKRASARIDFEKGTMQPPSKSILFNRQLLNNDGLLINEFSRENEVSYGEATEELARVLQHWNATLHSGGRIEIERVGNLFFDEERNICFEQDRFCNLLLESFGLGSVHFVAEEDVRLVEQSIAVKASKGIENLPKDAEPSHTTEIELEAPIIPIAQTQPTVPVTAATEESHPNRKRAWRYIAAACILPIAFYSVWIPAKTDVLESGMLSFHDFNPFHKASDAAYEPLKKKAVWDSKQATIVSLDEELKDVPNNVAVYSYKFTDDTYIKVRLPESEAAPIVAPDTPVVQKGQIEAFAPNAMHYIVGCFGDKSNADNLVARLRANGLSAEIVDVKGGLHRVSAGAAISEEAYQTIKLQADSMGLAGWRLR